MNNNAPPSLEFSSACSHVLELPSLYEGAVHLSATKMALMNDTLVSLVSWGRGCPQPPKIRFLMVGWGHKWGKGVKGLEGKPAPARPAHCHLETKHSLVLQAVHTQREPNGIAFLAE